MNNIFPYILFSKGKTEINQFSEPVLFLGEDEDDVNLSDLYFAEYLFNSFSNKVKLNKILNNSFWEPFYSSYPINSVLLKPNFIIESKEFCLAIEIKSFLSNKKQTTSYTENNRTYSRAECFQLFNWHYIQFTEKQIVENPIACCQIIKDVINQITNKTYNINELEFRGEVENFNHSSLYVENIQLNIIEKVLGKLSRSIIYFSKTGRNEYRIYGNLNFKNIVDANGKYEKYEIGDSFMIDLSNEIFSIKIKELHEQRVELKEEFNQLPHQEIKNIIKKIKDELEFSYNSYTQEKYYELNDFYVGNEKYIEIY